MLNNGITHHNKVRAELVRLYKLMTQRYYPVIAPRSVFLTTEQLEQLEKNPPVGGLARFSRLIETSVTIEKIIIAYEIGDVDFEMGFRHPSRDIPIIYETIQESIRLWIDIKMNSYSYKTASIEELRAMEKVARNLFSSYRHYYRENIREELNSTKKQTEFSMANLYISMLKYGQDGPDDISFVSYIDKYYEQINSRQEHIGVYVDAQKYNATIPVATPKLFTVPKQHDRLGEWIKRD